jgi:hypothetical protein
MPNCRRALYKGMKISVNPDYYERKVKNMTQMFEIKRVPPPPAPAPVQQPQPKPALKSMIIQLESSTVSFN